MAQVLLNHAAIYMTVNTVTVDMTRATGGHVEEKRARMLLVGVPSQAHRTVTSVKSSESRRALWRGSTLCPCEAAGVGGA